MEMVKPLSLLRATFFVLLLLTLALHALFTTTTSFLNHRRLEFLLHHKVLLFSVLWCTLVALLGYLSTRPRPVLFLDYVCFKPDNDRKLTYEASEYFVRRSRRFNTVSEEFMREIFLRSGLGDETYGPPFIFEEDYDAKYRSAIEEADEGMFSAVDSLFSKTRTHPSQVDTLIVACGMFSPSPSLSSRLVNRFPFRPGVKTFNMSSMGCSAGALSTDMAAKILSRSREIGYVLVVVTENISLNWYFGDNRSMLVSNCIFRLGTAAVMLTNDPARRGSAKMELVNAVVTNYGADDASYGVVFQEEDEDGNVGVTLKKELIRVAGGRLEDHVRKLAPLVLPVSQLVYYAYAVAKAAVSGGDKTKQPHVPDFTTAFEHMCVHAGGRAVIEAVERVMKLEEELMEPARMCLHRFGNSSGPLLFYELAYFDAKKRIKRGDRMWMVSFGAGFIVCSLVWRALQDSDADDPYNPWNDCAHVYPVNLQKMRQ